MDLKKKLGKMLVKLRHERGLSQQAVSWDTNIDPRYMSDLELGKRRLSMDKLEQIVTYYGMKFSDFFKLVEDMEDEDGECKE